MIGADHCGHIAGIVLHNDSNKVFSYTVQLEISEGETSYLSLKINLKDLLSYKNFQLYI